MIHQRYFDLAEAAATLKSDRRTFILGALGIRSDGVLVAAYNGPSTQVCPDAHAEARLARKLDVGATVYVVRKSRAGGEWALSRPCGNCLRKLRRRGVKRVYYTIRPGEYGTMIL